MKRILFWLFMAVLLAHAAAGQAATLLPDPCVPLDGGSVSAILFDGGEQTVERGAYTLASACVDGLIALDWPSLDPKRVRAVRLNPESDDAAYREACVTVDLGDIPALYPYAVTVEGVNAAGIAKVIGYARIPDPTCSVPIDLEVLSIIRHGGDVDTPPQAEPPSGDCFSFCFVSGETIKLRLGVRNGGQALFSWYEVLEDMREPAPGEAVTVTVVIAGGADGQEKRALTLTIMKGGPLVDEGAGEN